MPCIKFRIEWQHEFAFFFIFVVLCFLCILSIIAHNHNTPLSSKHHVIISYRRKPQDLPYLFLIRKATSSLGMMGKWSSHSFRILKCQKRLNKLEFLFKQLTMISLRTVLLKNLEFFDGEKCELNDDVYGLLKCLPFIHAHYFVFVPQFLLLFLNHNELKVVKNTAISHCDPVS